MTDAPPTIAVLGASGLIGSSIVEGLGARCFKVVAIARQFSDAQRNRLGNRAVELNFVGLPADRLTSIFQSLEADIVVNCVGVLQDGPRGRVKDAHEAFVGDLIGAIAGAPRPILLVHLSVPGDTSDDNTAFSQTKRAAEQMLRESSTPFVILRPGFVIAPSAFGGSALIRALAALPITLPATELRRPFAPVAVSDIVETVAVCAARWRAGGGDWRECWDVMERGGTTVSDVVEGFRLSFGGPVRKAAMPGWMLDFGAACGDAAVALGWSPPIRTTALKEMRRGVTGDPSRWIAATGIAPLPLDLALAALPATVQERWFSRLYLAKALVLICLSLFWIASGLVAIGPGYARAVEILVTSGFSVAFAGGLTWATSIADVIVGVLIAMRQTCVKGLVASIALASGYVIGATFLAPGLWTDPLGPLVKVVPTIVLAFLALAINESR
jgi:uncharacterized protein YbjT (DUF2867 family)